jgi:hypothetical protein
MSDGHGTFRPAGGPEPLTIDGISVTLSWDSDGPQLGRTGRPGEDVLGWFILVGANRRTLSDELSRAEEVIALAQEGPYALHVRDHEKQDLDHDGLTALENARRRWHEWSGQDAGDDAYLLGVPWGRYEELVVPRSFLLGLAVRLRAGHPPTGTSVTDLRPDQDPGQRPGRQQRPPSHVTVPGGSGGC